MRFANVVKFDKFGGFVSNPPNNELPNVGSEFPHPEQLESAAGSKNKETMRYPNYRKIKTTDVRNEFGWIVDHVAHGKERVILERRGRSLAAIIPMEDLRFLEIAFRKVEDALDVRDSDQALAEDAELIPYERVQKELGLNGSEASVHSASRKAAAAAAKEGPRARQRKVVGLSKSAVSKRNGKAAR